MELHQHEMPRFVILAQGQAQIEVIDWHGETRLKLPVTPGLHEAAENQWLVLPGETVRLTGDAVYIRKPSRIGRQRHPNARESGANPNWRPTIESQHERKMRQMLEQVQAQARTVEKRLKALAKVSDGLELVEKATEPAPVTEAQTTQADAETAPNA